MPVSSKVTNQPARPGSHVIYFHRIRQYKDKIPEVLPDSLVKKRQDIFMLKDKFLKNRLNMYSFIFCS